MIRGHVVATAVLACSLASSSLSSAPPESQDSLQEEHAAWVAWVLEQMLTIKPGMTRSQLLTVFTTEGGMYTSLQRRFVSRECRYFKVDVRFEAVGGASPDHGRVEEGPDDRIVTISKPFLEFEVTD